MIAELRSVPGGWGVWYENEAGVTSPVLVRRCEDRGLHLDAATANGRGTPVGVVMVQGLKCECSSCARADAVRTFKGRQRHDDGWTQAHYVGATIEEARRFARQLGADEVQVRGQTTAAQTVIDLADAA